MALDPLDVDVPNVDPDEPLFKRVVATTIALVALFAALVAYLETQASVRSGQATTEVHESAAASVRSVLSQQEELRRAFGIWGLAQQFQVLRGLANDESRRNLATPVGQAAQAEAERWRSVAASLTGLTPLLNEAEYSQDRDPAFPQRYANQTAVDASFDTLRERVFAEAAGRWDDKARRLRTVLVLLAVVLFFLGLSLAARQWLRLIFLVPAGFLLLSCLVSTISAARVPVPVVTDEAIKEVAEGDRLAANLDYDGAIARFDRAIRMQPAFALAYSHRATARFAAGAEVVPGQLFFSYSDPAAVREAVADSRKAVSRGAGNDVATMSTLGALLFHLRDYEGAEGVLRSALRLNDANPIAWTNLGASLAAAGDEVGATEVYRKGVEAIGRRPSSVERRGLYGSAVSVLEHVAQREPGQRALTDVLKERLVRAQVDADLGRPSGTDADVRDFSLRINGLSVQADFAIQGLRAGTPVAVVWYSRTFPDRPFTVDPTMTTVEMAKADVTGPISFARYPSVCGQGGEYRAELYVNHRHVASAATTRPPNRLGPMVYAFDNALGVAFCRPVSWVKEAFPGMVLGVAAPDRRSGFAVTSLPLSAALAGAGFDPALLALQVAGAGERPLSDARERRIGDAQGLSARYTHTAGEQEISAFMTPDKTKLIIVVAFAPRDPAAQVADVFATLQFYVGTP